MPMNEMQKQTNANIQAKANLIWEIATHLVGLFKPHEYGKVILPMTVLKRFDDALKPTKALPVTVFCAVWRSTISTTQATMILPS